MTDDGSPAWLSVTRVLVKVRVPAFAMPPPLANEQSNGPQKPDGRSCSEATLLPVMTLSLIATVAPRPPRVEKDPTTISTPPPCVTAWSGLELLKPPVTVTPVIETVGSVVDCSWPMRSTGPPPVMVVAPAPDPRMSTLTSIVTPPANVPGAIVIVSPSLAAFTAAWIVEKQPGLLPTQRLVAALAE